MLRQIGRLVAARGCRVLAYHGVGDLPAELDPHGLQVEAAAFRRQVELLQAAGFTFVTASDLVRRAAAGERGLVALTFDDAMEDNHHVALPLLRELGGLPATVFVISGLMGEPNPWLAPGAARFMTREEVLACHDAGWEIGAHTVTHPDLSTMDHAACLSEMTDSRDTLEALIGAPVQTFAYPFCRYGPAARDAAIDAGFVAAFTCMALGGPRDRHALRRSIIIRGDSPAIFTGRLSGAYDPLFYGPVGQFARDRTRGLRTALAGRSRA